MVYYTTLTKQRCRYPTAHLALVNWFVDMITNDQEDFIVNVATGSHFIDQVLAALERNHGRSLRIDCSQPAPMQCEEILKFIHATGGFKKLKITSH